MRTIFFTNCPNKYVEKLKQELFESTYTAFISELPFTLCNQITQLLGQAHVTLWSLFEIRRACKCIILFIGGVSVKS